LKLSAELIHGFMGSVLSSGLDEPAPTPDCHLEWWALCCSDYKRVAIAAPRGHAKSTAITKAYTLASVLFRDRSFVLVVSDTYKQACLFLGEIKRELTSNETLISLFGVKELKTDREEDIVVEFDDGQQFRIMALGSEQKVRGLLWNGKRPDLIVGDDLENDEIVMNPERREKFRGWMMNALLPCMSEKGIVRIVGTILHMDSALERLMPKDRSDNSLISDLCVKMRKPIGGWMGVRYQAHGPHADYEQILWPVKWTEKRLKEIKAMFEGQGNPEGYYQEYLNRPIDPRNSFFRKDDFQDYEEIDKDRGFEFYPTYLACDLAVTTKERRDWCAFIIGSVDETGMLYIRHVIRERMDSKEIVDTIIRLQERYKFNVMLIGKGALEKAIGPFLKDAIRRTRKFLHLEAIPDVLDKRSKATSIRGRMRAGGVKFDKKRKWFSDLEQEMLEFDRGVHDDQVDAMALFGMYLDHVIDAPTAKEIEEEVWDMENAKDLNDLTFNQGRSQTTGY
jgi:predicted phage terminase large subunit-like protein